LRQDPQNPGILNFVVSEIDSRRMLVRSDTNMSGQPERPDEGVAAREADGQDNLDVSEAEALNEPEEGDELAALKATAAENWDKFLRAAAELENVRKRAARDVENAHKFALERFSTDLLDVRDSLEMALATGAEVDIASLMAGNEATLKLLAAVMQRYGVQELDPLGEPFDPAMHEAMTMQPSADAEPGSILTVFQKGYALNGRLLRPARVVVAAELPEI
jgi:molecular chaperone GrpE